jgi:hypothetical protein
VNYTDAKLLIEFATLQARITEDHGALSIDPVALAGSPRVRLTQTKGYRDLRAFFDRLSPRAKEGFRRQLRMQIDGVRAVLKRCAETGEKPSLADLEISVTDAETGLPADGRCGGSGAGITEPVDERVGCQRCMASWHQNDIGFKIPEHQEEKA